MENIFPVASVGDRVRTSAIKNSHVISCQRIFIKVFFLGTIVEEKITTQLQNKHAVVMRDGLTRYGNHFIGMGVACVLD